MASVSVAFSSCRFNQLNIFSATRFSNSGLTSFAGSSTAGVSSAGAGVDSGALSSTFFSSSTACFVLSPILENKNLSTYRNLLLSKWNFLFYWHILLWLRLALRCSLFSLLLLLKCLNLSLVQFSSHLVLANA